MHVRCPRIRGSRVRASAGASPRSSVARSSRSAGSGRPTARELRPLRVEKRPSTPRACGAPAAPTPTRPPTARLPGEACPQSTAGPGAARAGGGGPLSRTSRNASRNDIGSLPSDGSSVERAIEASSSATPASSAVAARRRSARSPRRDIRRSSAIDASARPRHRVAQRVEIDIDVVPHPSRAARTG